MNGLAWAVIGVVIVIGLVDGAIAWLITGSRAMVVLTFAVVLGSAALGYAAALLLGALISGSAS